MGSLHDHFAPASSGYTIHRAVLRPERLPACCRKGLADCGRAVKLLDSDGNEILRPLRQCGVCGRCYAIDGQKYLLVDNPLRYEIVVLSE